MKLQDKIKELEQDMTVYDFEGEGYGAYLIGFNEVIEKATELVIQYDNFVDDLVGHRKL